MALSSPDIDPTSHAGPSLAPSLSLNLRSAAFSALEAALAKTVGLQSDGATNVEDLELVLEHYFHSGRSLGSFTPHHRCVSMATFSPFTGVQVLKFSNGLSTRFKAATRRPILASLSGETLFVKKRPRVRGVHGW